MIPMRRLAGLAAALTLLVACGSGEGDAELSVGAGGGAAPAPEEGGGRSGPVAGPAPGDVSRACGVLSPSDVAQVLGNPVKAGTGEGTFCFWGTQVDRGTSANLTLERPAAGRVEAQCSTQRNSQAKEAKQDSVGNVGSSAVWVWQPVSILLQGNLVACFDDAVIVVGLTGEKDQAVLRNQAVALAETVHNRI